MDTSEQEVLTQCIDWLTAGYGVELITVARTWGSSPRPVGSLAAVRDDGVLVGSVSGGCVEKQLSSSYKERKTAEVFSHTIDDNDARKFGLSCGGNLELVFETLQDPQPLREIMAQLEARQRIKRTITLGQQDAVTTVATRDDQFAFDGHALTRIFGPAWRVLLIGAGQLSRYTAEFALALDYEVLVCEPRGEFRAAWQLPGTTLLSELPDDAVLAHAVDAQSAVLALTHDPNLDDLALLEALPAESFYVGALGSRKNYQNRVKRLAALGLSDTDIARLHGPVGLSIGSRTSAEIAVSIVAELISVRAKMATERVDV